MLLHNAIHMLKISLVNQIQFLGDCILHINTFVGGGCRAPGIMIALLDSTTLSCYYLGIECHSLLISGVVQFSIAMKSSCVTLDLYAVCLKKQNQCTLY